MKISFQMALVGLGILMIIVIYLETVVSAYSYGEWHKQTEPTCPCAVWRLRR